MLTATKSFSPDSILNRLGLDHTVFGLGVCTALPDTLDRLAARRVLLVSDPIATDACNISSSLQNCLSRDVKCGVVDVTATLSPAEVDQFGTTCEEGDYDCIVAVGGGATMDAAKLIAIRASNSKPLDQLLSDGFSPNHIPLVAAPTTAGSGSEATHFAVLFVEQEKFSMAHPSLRPSWAVVDPTLTYSSPQRVAAAAGLDVLCQSIESLWSEN
ncbi:MAG: iron-containing alcohol dehydrogenase, partial [Aeoliella sp.]